MKEGRKRIWVDPFQSKLFLRVVAYWAVYQFTLWNILFTWRLLERGEGRFLAEYWQFFFDFYPMLLCFLLLVPFFAWDSVRFSHRLVGPIVRFRRSMQAIASGEPVQPIKLREGDYLIDLQDDFNAMLASLQQRALVPTAGEPSTSDSRSGVLA
jgi:hypothetical protein